MLVPVQTSGSKPPLFFVHGMYGVMPLGGIFAPVLGKDQPLYSLQANGIDGRQLVIDDFEKMVRQYTEEIEGTRPSGAIRIGGMCTGCMVAIEIARRFQENDRPTGPVILADPTPLPAGYDRPKPEVDHRDPRTAQQLYHQARRMLVEYASYPYNQMPFDPGDAAQLHHAALAGVGSLVAFARHVPRPFPGAAELIISAEHAPGFFHPQMAWYKLLPGPRTVYVLPGRHRELFRDSREEVARLLKFMLDRPIDVPAEYRAEASPT
jgi:thioesterase domain-containing protein